MPECDRTRPYCFPDRVEVDRCCRVSLSERLSCAQLERSCKTDISTDSEPFICLAAMMPRVVLPRNREDEFAGRTYRLACMNLDVYMRRFTSITTIQSRISTATGCEDIQQSQQSEGLGAKVIVTRTKEPGVGSPGDIPRSITLIGITSLHTSHDVTKRRMCSFLALKRCNQLSLAKGGNATA